MQYLMISIHAPRTGCDQFIATRTTNESISIHAPRTGCDSERLQKTKPVSVSLSQHRFVFVSCRQTARAQRRLFFSAKLPGNPRVLWVRASNHQHAFRRIGFPYAHMLDLGCITVSKLIEAKAVLFLVDQCG